MIALALLAAVLAQAPGPVAPADARPVTPAAPAAPAAASPAGPGPAMPAEAHPIAVHTGAQPEEITLGEPVVWTIAIDHDARDTYSLPEKIQAAPMTLVGTPASMRKDGSGPATRAVVLTTTTFRLTFSDVSTVEPRIPDLTLHALGPDGPRELRIPGRPLKFHSLVKDEGEGSEEHAHHGPKPPVDVVVRSLLWLWLLLGLGALVTTAVLVRRALAGRKLRAGVRPAILMQPDEEAIASLAKLKDAAPWKRGEGRAAIFALSEITRAYLGRRLYFNALDLTSEELLVVLRQRALIGLDLRTMEEEVRWEDLVKFAKLEPLPEECLRGIERALTLVSRTRPARPSGAETTGEKAA